VTGMADCSAARAVVEMYAGGDLERIEEWLAEDVAWHAPGTSPIAGDYRGREAVNGHFLRRRALAGRDPGGCRASVAPHSVALSNFAIWCEPCRFS